MEEATCKSHNSKISTFFAISGGRSQEEGTDETHMEQSKDLLRLG